MAEDLIIAIDGPSGVGKSTVSRRVARHFGIQHLDTGAFYRAATLAVLESGQSDPGAFDVISIVRSADIVQQDGATRLNGVDVSRAIRSEAVTRAVSEVSAIPAVREMMVERQREWVAAHGGGAVVEGRDIGSVVFPDATCKIFLTADPDERAKRRAGEGGASHRATRADLDRRDTYDSQRATSPLIVAEGAIVIDTTDLTLPEVVDLVIAEVRTA